MRNRAKNMLNTRECPIYKPTMDTRHASSHPPPLSYNFHADLIGGKHEAKRLSIGLFTICSQQSAGNQPRGTRIASLDHLSLDPGLSRSRLVILFAKYITQRPSPPRLSSPPRQSISQPPPLVCAHRYSSRTRVTMSKHP